MGLDLLWDLVLNGEQHEVFEAAAKLLTMIYLNVSDHLSEHHKEYRLELIDKCFGYLSKSREVLSN